MQEGFWPRGVEVSHAQAAPGAAQEAPVQVSTDGGSHAEPEGEVISLNAVDRGDDGRWQLDGKVVQHPLDGGAEIRAMEGHMSSPEDSGALLGTCRVISLGADVVTYF